MGKNNFWKQDEPKVVKRQSKISEKRMIQFLDERFKFLFGDICKDFVLKHKGNSTQIHALMRYMEHRMESEHFLKEFKL